MEKILSQVKQFIQDEQGATAVEYGLMVALIAGVITVSVTSLGTAVDGKFSAVATTITNAGAGGAGGGA